MNGVGLFNIFYTCVVYVDLSLNLDNMILNSTAKRSDGPARSSARSALAFELVAGKNYAINSLN